VDVLTFVSRRRLAPALMLALGGLAVPAAAPAVADTCANQAVREQQGATRLPDCRAYERVSPVDKNGGTIAAGQTARAEPGGISFWSTGGFAGTQSNIGSNYVALRTDDGWQTTALNPPLTGRDPVLADQVYVVGLARDYSRALLVSRYPFAAGDQAPGGGGMDVFRTEPDGGFTWISQPATLPDLSARALDFAAATDDLERVVVNSFKPLTPGVTSDTTQQVYVRDGEVTRLVSVAPEGTLDGAGDPLPPGSPMPGGVAFGDGIASSGSGSLVGGSSPSALSDDGSTVYFASYRGTTNPQVYVRVNALDPVRGETRVVTRSHVTGAPAGAQCTVTVNFLAANRDGSKAWFACPARLTDDAPANGGLYVYDRGADQLHFIAATAGGGMNVGMLGADPDVDHLWFTSSARLTDDANGSKLNIYVLTGDTVSLAASTGDASFAPAGVAVSPDGSRIVFEGRAALDPRAGSFAQVYTAQAGVSGAVCVSCRPDGSPSAAIADLRNVGLAPFVGANRSRPLGAIDDDGRAFFTSADKLVPEDQNGTADVYQYRDGELTLISSGTDPGGAVFAGASADGTDVFFITAERLAPQDTDNGVADMYTARAGGGFLATAQPAECEDDCQGPAPAPFTPPTPETGVFTGPGDVDDPVPPAAPKLTVGTITAKQRVAWARTGRTTLNVRVTQSGTVRATVRAKLGQRTVRVATASRRFSRGGTAKLGLRLSKRARTYLTRHRVVKVTVTVSYSRVRGAKRTTVTLRKPAVKRTNGGKR
jgi:hypothetical protein